MTAGAVVGTRVAAGGAATVAPHLGQQPVAAAEGAAAALSHYREYDRSVCLQMVGRAGRPQFDTEGVAVIMTQTEVGSEKVLGSFRSASGQVMSSL